MKLQNNLYTVTSGNHNPETINLEHETWNLKPETVEADYQILLNPECPIYEAHFPGQPITPGVCVIQIAKELTEALLDQSVMMLGAKDVKFLSVMVPDGEEITYRLTVNRQEDGMVYVKAEAKSNSTVYAKMSLQLKVLNLCNS